jgi:hypothetical protein
MAGPVPYRTKSAQQYTGSFPPPVYYRDTFGLQPVQDRRLTESMTTENSDDSVTTKSTVRTTMNIYHPTTTNHMYESQHTDATPSYQVERILTNQVIITQARTLLILNLIAFGAAIQLSMFSVICILFDGSPYRLALIGSFLFLLNGACVFYFLKWRHSRAMLITCCVTTSITFILCVALFFWTAYLIYGEDKQIRDDGFDFAKADLRRSNHIVSNTRLAMYSLQMILVPVQAVCCAGILCILYKNLHDLQDGRVSKGYFFTKPLGHQVRMSVLLIFCVLLLLQTVLVPIELKQVRRLNEEPENASIGVQTSGTTREVG